MPDLPILDRAFVWCAVRIYRLYRWLRRMENGDV